MSGAKGYIVYGAKVGSKFKKLAELSASKKTWTHKKLKKGTYYKYVVVAYKAKSNVKKVAATSKTAVMATTSGKVTNAKSVKLSKTKVKLKKGKSLKLKATLVQAKKKLKLKKYKAVAFESSNSKIASVSKKGKVKAKKKGTCYVYACAQNGVCKRAKVTVK